MAGWNWFKSDDAQAKAARQTVVTATCWLLGALLFLACYRVVYAIWPSPSSSASSAVVPVLSVNSQRCSAQLLQLHKQGIGECGTCLHEAQHCCIFDWDEKAIIQLPGFSIVQESGGKQDIEATTWYCRRRSARVLPFSRFNRVRVRLETGDTLWLDAQQAFCAQLLSDMLHDKLDC